MRRLPIAYPGAKLGLYCGGCCCSTRDRCRIVSLIRGRCLTMRSKMRLALSRLEPPTFCHIFPVARGMLEKVDPEVHDLTEQPELESSYFAWARSRAHFNADLDDPTSTARRDEWQKRYFRGLGPDDVRAVATNEHRTALRLKDFR